MRRTGLHLLFWAVYFLQEVLLSLTWAGPALHITALGELLATATLAAFVGIAPKVFLTYFVLQITIPQVMRGTVPMGRILLALLGGMIVSVIIYRLISFFLIYPVVYQGRLAPVPMFDVGGILVAMIDTGFIAGLAAGLKFTRLQLATMQKQKNLTREKLETELKFLRNQTHPHFLMNTLNNIYALARRQSDLVPELVMRLSELLRFMLYESGGDTILLRDEIRVLEDYLQLEMMRYDDRLTVSMQKKADDPACRITPLLLLPFIENAFKHGISESRFDAFLHISVEAEKGWLTFISENSRETSDVPEGRSNIGLANARRQLELSYGEYRLDIADEKTLFRVSLTINLDSHVKL